MLNQNNRLFLCILLLLGLLSCADSASEIDSETPPGTEIVDSASSTPDAVMPTQAKIDTQVWDEPVDTSELVLTEGYYTIDWFLLKKVKFIESFSEEMNALVPFPYFHPTLQYLDGKRVRIEGYVIPFEEAGDTGMLILSAFPFSNCFFCGGAGPESVMDIKLKDTGNTNFKTDQRLTFKGRLKLNDADLYYLNYILEDAVAE